MQTEEERTHKRWRRETSAIARTHAVTFNQHCGLQAKWKGRKMKQGLWLVIFLVGTVAYAAEEQTAAATLQRYLTLPFPAADRLGEARIARLRTLDELRAKPEAAVREIVRVLPELKDPRQRAELAETLRHFPTKEAAAKLCELLDDSDAQVRGQAIHSLRLLARRVDRSGGQRTQRGAEFAPKVDGLVPFLIKAASDKSEQNRVSALFALADTLDPAAVAEIRRRLQDESSDVRFRAACFLTEFQDASGLGELKQALKRFRSAAATDWSSEWNTEPLLASFERITGKSFGSVPMNPGLSSDSRVAEQSRRKHKELLDTWAAWWAWEPSTSRATTRRRAVELVEIKDMKPLEFLSYLEKSPAVCCEIARVPDGWVKADQLADLFKHLDSDQECASVVATGWSPHVAVSKPSTVGREAAFLIQSFRTQRYPAPLGSMLTEQDKTELRQWWAQYSRSKK